MKGEKSIKHLLLRTELTINNIIHAYQRTYKSNIFYIVLDGVIRLIFTNDKSVTMFVCLVNHSHILR